MAVRRVIFIMAALAILAAPPCRAAGPAAEICLWTSETPKERQAVIRYLADVFMALNPGVRVTVVGVDENEFVRCAVEPKDCGPAPDLVNTSADLIVALGERGLLDVAAATAAVDAIGRNRFSKGALLAFSTAHGRYYGVPHHGWVQGIWYRADWFVQAGLAPPKTWRDILRAAKRFTSPEKGSYGILIGTMPDNYAEQVFTQIALSNDARMFTPDGALAFDSPAMVEALEFYLELAKCTPPGPQTWRGRDYYLQGRLAMLFYSTFIMDDLALPGVAADSLGAGHFEGLGGAKFDPKLAGNTRMVASIRHAALSGFGSINGFSPCRVADPKRREAARKLLAFLYEPGPYVEWLHMSPGGMLPALRSVADSEGFMNDPEGVFQRFGRAKIRRILSGLDSIRTFGMTDGRHYPLASVFYAEKVVPRMIARALSGELSPAGAVAWADGEMRRIAAQRDAAGDRE